MVKRLAFSLLLSLCFTSNAYVIPHFTAKSWLVADKNGKVIDGNNTLEVRSIASITKLMTVMVILDAKQDLNEVLLPRRLTRRELIGLAIVHSDNSAAKLLCDNYPGGYRDCIQAMNLKAVELGMPESKFIEPTGLSIFNVSTAQDLVKLVLAASKYPIINEDSNKDVIRIPVNRKKSAQFRNTNSLVGHYDFKVSKTGWINKSGGCIVMMIDANNKEKIIILLGSKNTHTRIPEAKMIALTY